MNYSSIDELAEQVHETAKEKGWYEGSSNNFCEKIALIHSELSEMLEEYRDGRGYSEVYYRESDGKPEGISIEAADAIIRILDMCAYYNIPVGRALEEKIEFNKGRPYRHGGKVA